MNYLNFDLTFGQKAGEGYPVTAAGPLGQAPAAGQPTPLSALNAADPGLIAALELVRRGRTNTAGLRALGEALAAALPAPILELLREHRAAARAQPNQGLRLRLNVMAPELAELPWELLWLPGDNAPLGVSTGGVITRFLNFRTPVRGLEAPRPLRLLGIAPQAPNLDLAAHKAALEDAVAEMQASGALEYQWLDGIVTRDRIRAELGRAETHLVHFVGHGSFEGGAARLHLNDDYGDDYPVPASTVAGFFRDRPSVRLVALNACRGAAQNSAAALLGLAPQIAEQGVPAVIAMQWDIYDWAAQKFAAEFYRSLCAGPEAGEADTALTRARAALYDDDPDARGYATPVLLLRAEGERLWEEKAETEKEKKIEAGEIRDSILFGDNTKIEGEVYTGGKRVVNMGGGTYYEGAINVTDGDFVGGNKTVTQRAGRDIIGRDKVTHTSADPVQMQALLKKFEQIQEQIDALSATPSVDPEQIKVLVKQIEAESRQGEAADEKRLEGWLTALGNAAEDIFEVTAAALTNPALGVAQAVRKVAQRVQDSRRKT